MSHFLPPLPYDEDALEPYIDARTMQIHHDKHHQAYVDNLNKALESAPALADWAVDDLIANLEGVPENIRTAVRNNAGGHYNHLMFWDSMGPDGGGEPDGALGQAISDAFGGFDDFKAQITQAGLTRFGSGWAWLSMDGGNLSIESMPNQDNPLMEGRLPVLGVDVWEHAYYLNYQNRRKDYLDAWWNTVNWEAVAGRYERLKG